jgi:hypothetical protein
MYKIFMDEIPVCVLSTCYTPNTGTNWVKDIDCCDDADKQKCADEENYDKVKLS